jgi:hypothetical protein
MILLTEHGAPDFFSDQTENCSGFLQMFPSFVNWSVTGMSGAISNFDGLDDFVPADATKSVCQSFVTVQFVAHLITPSLV